MDIEYKFNYKYNPKSNRLENYDYSENWWYFITICTKDRQEYFGEIIEGEMILNEYWKVVEKFYLEIPNHFKNIIIDEFVIMPNHIHFIIFIDKKNVLWNNEDVLWNKEDVLWNKEDVLWNKKDVAVLHLYGNDDEKFSKKYYSNISPKKWELWTIIRSFKSICTREINKLELNIYFAWQKNYYDRIIRNEDELKRIRVYIKNNPLKWELEKDNELWIFI